MAKRMTDSGKWEKPWFRRLPMPYKLFWFYLLDKCSYAGLWDVDFELASFHVGHPLDIAEGLRLFEPQIQVVDSGRKWFVVDFIRFQYGHLTNSQVHDNVRKELARYGLSPTVAPTVAPTVDPTVDPGVAPTPKAKDTDTDTDTVTVTEEDKAKAKAKARPDNVAMLLDYFQSIGGDGNQANRFADHYESNGWRVGKGGTRMRDWKAAARNWMRNVRDWQGESEGSGAKEVVVESREDYYGFQTFLSKAGIKTEVKRVDGKFWAFRGEGVGKYWADFKKGGRR